MRFAVAIFLTCAYAVILWVAWDDPDERRRAQAVLYGTLGGFGLTLTWLAAIYAR